MERYIGKWTDRNKKRKINLASTGHKPVSRLCMCANAEYCWCNPD